MEQLQGMTLTWVLGMSGGKDSMVLAQIFQELGISFVGAHINYGFRAAESDGDALFVADWCKGNGIALELLQLDGITALAGNGENLQAWARRQRYDFFEKIRKKHKAQLIATAQHADDQVETVLLQLFRGAGLKGMAGMQLQSSYIVRPLLYSSQNDIDAFAADRQLVWRQDSSNAKTDYRRNALRQNVIPQLKAIYPQLQDTMLQSTAHFAATERFLASILQQKRRLLLKERDGRWLLGIKLLAKEAELPTLLHYLLQPYGFGAAKVAEVIKLMDASQGAYILSDSFRLMKSGGNLVLEGKAAERPVFWIEESAVRQGCSLAIDDKRVGLSMEGVSMGSVQYGGQTQYIAADRLIWPLLLRPAQPGDYFYPLGLNKKKKVAKLLIDAKIPVELRSTTWVLLSGQRIISVIGFRIDHRYKLEKNTQSALKLVIG